MKHSLDPLLVSPENVWEYAQNKPTLIARDLERHGVPRPVTYAVLMARGVFKWLAVRRDLVRLKHAWRQEITRLHADLLAHKAARNRDGVIATRARLAALVECRHAIRSLCHSERWRCPDFDGEAWGWLNSRAPMVTDGVPQDVRQLIRHGYDRDELAEREVA